MIRISECVNTSSLVTLLDLWPEGRFVVKVEDIMQSREGILGFETTQENLILVQTHLPSIQVITAT